MDRSLSLSLLMSLMSQGGASVVFALIVTRSRPLRKILTRERTNVRDTVVMIFFFSGIGILGTYTGIPVRGAIANARVVGVFVGGLLGGPIVGVAAGLIAGFHRWAIDVGGFTAVACMLSTMAEGLLAAALYKAFSRSENKWLAAALFAAGAEVVQMGIILLVAKPFSEALVLVRIIALPMIVGNAFGVGVFIAIAESLYREKERVAAQQAQETLLIANRTLEIFRKGLTIESAQAAAGIIMEYLDVAAVSLTDTKNVLAYVGDGEDHHATGELVQTQLTRDVLTAATYAVAQSFEKIGCAHEDCPLGSAVIVPLREGEVVVGTLKLYRRRKDTLTSLDTELALGLAGLFSTQLELSRLETQRQLIDRAEMEALQSQINPHFLFNALNTIGSLIRSNPERARQLLVTLSGFFRRNLSVKDDVTLEQELDHVREYLEIEKARFGDRLSVVFSIDPDVCVSIPPLILQPIVENAVKHGLLPQVEGGTVTVRATVNGETATITVSDDGTGMSPDKVAAVMSGTSNHGSVGLMNVNKRLRMRFGTGLTLLSSEGSGTSVTVEVPQIQEGISCVS